jgi:hypothetical protein
LKNISQVWSLALIVLLPKSSLIVLLFWIYYLRENVVSQMLVVFIVFWISKISRTFIF